MRLVIATTDVPPDAAGMPYQRWAYSLVTQLVARGHDVWFSAIASDPEQAARSRRALAGCAVDLNIYAPARRRHSLRGKLQTLRMPFSRNIPDDLRAAVRAACDRGYDVLHLENFQWASYLGWGMERTLASIHMLYFVDWRGSGFRSWRFTRDRLLFAYAERKSLRRLRHFHVLTDELGDTVRAVNPRARVHTVPISIEPSDYRVFASDRAPKVVGLIGSMRFETSRRAAVRLLTSIWPRVRRRVPEARLVVAGWAARSELVAHVGDPGVEIREDIASAADFFGQCAVFAYPLAAGGGLKGKVLEALAHGVPLVTTRAGIAGVEAKHGLQAFIEDDNDQFAERVVELLEHPDLRRRLAEAGRMLVEERYAPGPVVDQIESVYRTVAAGR
jgi:glycosyltransferase involved in cell wall biosynthesis